MAINVNLANSQANQLRSSSSNLLDAKKQLLNYKNTMILDWQAKEVGYITLAIDQIIDEIDSAISTLNALGNDVSSTANTIRQEEEAAAARAREEERRRREAAAAEEARRRQEAAAEEARKNAEVQRAAEEAKRIADSTIKKKVEQDNVKTIADSMARISRNIFSGRFW